tara:strand:+ start:546 stop:722 length:177 start_codon:yes stop_codon:yes gene_type:complete
MTVTPKQLKEIKELYQYKINDCSPWVCYEDVQIDLNHYIGLTLTDKEARNLLEVLDGE